MKKILFLISILIPSIAIAGPHVRNESQSSLYAAEGDTQPTSAVDRYANQMCSLQAGTASATNPIKLEDTTSASGDAGIGIFGIRNDTAAALTGTNADYGFPVVNQYGGVVADLDIRFQGNGTGARSPIRAEDDASASGDAGVVILTHARTALTPLVASSGDYSHVVSDDLGRLITTLAPAGETWQACTGAITDTTQTAIKAAVPSNRIYVTSFGCNNTAAVASTVVLQDGSTAIWQASVSNSTLQGVASFQHTHPVPLRGTVNTALNVTLGTTATNTRCCAAGYISVN